MTRSQTIYRKQLLALIHTNALFKEIKANDAWEMWLSMRFGVTSAAKLSIEEMILKMALSLILKDALTSIMTHLKSRWRRLHKLNI